MAATRMQVLHMLYCSRFFRGKRKSGINAMRRRLDSLRLRDNQRNNALCTITMLVLAHCLLRERQFWSFHRPNGSYWERA